MSLGTVIEGTRWQVVAVPSGMRIVPQYGMSGEISQDFSETVVCAEEVAWPHDTVAHYGERQLVRLKGQLAEFASEGPNGVIWDGGDAVLFAITGAYQGTAVAQQHFYVQKLGNMGSVIWTHRPQLAQPIERFKVLLAGLRFG